MPARYNHRETPDSSHVPPRITSGQREAVRQRGRAGRAARGSTGLQQVVGKAANRYNARHIDNAKQSSKRGERKVTTRAGGCGANSADRRKHPALVTHPSAVCGANLFTQSKHAISCSTATCVQILSTADVVRCYLRWTEALMLGGRGEESGCDGCADRANTAHPLVAARTVVDRFPLRVTRTSDVGSSISHGSPQLVIQNNRDEPR
jgi:hypothetical protein